MEQREVLKLGSHMKIVPLHDDEMTHKRAVTCRDFSRYFMRVTQDSRRSTTMIEHYTAKVWLRVPLSMEEIATRLQLQDTKNFTTDLYNQKLVGRVGEQLWIINLSLGSWEAAQKIKVYAIPGMSTEDASKFAIYVDEVLNER